MVLVQIIDISTTPHNDIRLNLSDNKLKGFSYLPGTIKNYNQYEFHNLLQGDKQYRYFINQIKDDNDISQLNIN